MTKMLTLPDIEKNPGIVTEIITLLTGPRVVLRLLRPDDASLLGRFFLGLSAETRRRFAPHPFTREEADTLCSQINYRSTIRLVAATDASGVPEIIAYFILIPGFGDTDQKRYEGRGTPLDRDSDCSVAPCVADAFQNQGLGSLLFRKVIQLAKRLGRKRAVLIGGVQAANIRAIHFYTKLGFRQVGTFSTGIENYDMILDLQS